MQKQFTLDADFDIVGYETKLEKSNNVSLKDLTGAVGYALGMANAANNFISSGAFALTNTGLLTFSCVVNLTGKQSYGQQVLLSSNDYGDAGWLRFGITQSSDNIYFYYSHSGGTDTATPAWTGAMTGLWGTVVQIDFTLNASTKEMIVYINGVSIGSKTLTYIPIIPTASHAKYFGHESNLTNYKITGTIDEIYLYNEVKTPAWILANSKVYRTTEATMEVGYHCDEGTGTTLDNMTGVSARDGAIGSAVTWVTGLVPKPSSYASDSPQAKLIEAGQVYSIDAGSGYLLKPSAFADTEITAAGSSIKYRYVKSSSGSYPTTGWSTWKTTAEMNALCTGGSLDGKRYLYIESQYNSDGVTDATLSDATITYTVEAGVDYDELPVATEGSAVETFSWVPDYVIPVQESFKTRRHIFEAGYEQTYPEFSKQRRKFQLKFMSRDYAEMRAILNFVEARKGAEEAFYFTPEDEVTPIKVCVDGDPGCVKVNPNVYNLELEFLEVY